MRLRFAAHQGRIESRLDVLERAPAAVGRALYHPFGAGPWRAYCRVCSVGGYGSLSRIGLGFVAVAIQQTKSENASERDVNRAREMIDGLATPSRSWFGRYLRSAKSAYTDWASRCPGGWCLQLSLSLTSGETGCRPLGAFTELSIPGVK